MKIKTEFRNLSWQPVNPQLIGIRPLAAWSLKTLSFSILNELNVLTESGRWRGIFFQFPVSKIFVVPLFHPQKGIFPLFQQKNFCYKPPPLYNGHYFFFTSSPYIHSCLQRPLSSVSKGLKRFGNCVPLLHPKRDQLEKYFLYFLWFYSYLVPEN